MQAPSATPYAGFSLLEMAVVIALMSVMLTMGLGLMNAKMESAAQSETKLKQEKIKVALVAFLRQNGRLPCPNRAPWDGLEMSPCLNNNGRGIIPWRALGLSRSDVVDGWGNFISYRISNRTPASSKNWTITSDTTAFTVNELNNPSIALTVQERFDNGALSLLSDKAVVVLVSHGKNGLGARTVAGTSLTAPAGADEAANAAAASVTFFVRRPNEVAASVGGLFDDMVTYMTPSDLLQPLIEDKTLRGRSVQQYRELAIQQVAVVSCTPPIALPSFNLIEPNIGFDGIVYSCPNDNTYLCRAQTALISTTPANSRLYQLSIFGATATDVTYEDVWRAYPSITARCP
jgi:prepilin-type N-terminal cleavage/methylation domain-containing protein